MRVLVTGAGSGIGRACCLRLAQDARQKGTAARIAAVDLQVNDHLQQLQQELKAMGAETLLLGGDMSCATVPEEVVSAAVTQFGGLDALIARANANAQVITDWVEATPWIDFLAADPMIRSNTSVCLQFTAPEISTLDPGARAAFAKSVAGALEAEHVAYDIGSYRDAPPGLRIWCGATVEQSDVEALTPWIDWAYHQAAARLASAA